MIAPIEFNVGLVVYHYRQKRNFFAYRLGLSQATRLLAVK